MHTKDYLPESPSKGLPSMRTSKAHLRKPFPKLVSLLKSRTAQNGTANTAAVGDTPKIVVPRAASLDGLPFELKLVILRELSDLQSLRNLIDASVSYREVASHSLLFKVFVKDVHPELLFELSLIKTTLENNRDLSTSVSDIREYVQGHRASPKLPSIYEQLAPDLALKILSIQVAVHHATKQFCQPMLSHNPLTGEAVTNKIPLSHNEIRRIHRAFYHFELFCIVFKKLELHRNDPLISQTEQMAFDARGRCLLFLSLFEAFKMEELAIVRDFIMRCYHDMLLESELHLRQYSTARIPRAPWLNWRKETNYVISNRELEACQEHYLSLGLEFFQRVTQANHAERISLLRDNLSVSYSFLTQTLAEEPPNPIILSFIENEAGPDTLDHAVDLPNAAWSWSMICVEVLRYFQPEAEGLRKWGYAVWDKERLCDWGNGSVRTVFQEVQIEQRLPPVVRERYW